MVTFSVRPFVQFGALPLKFSLPFVRFIMVFRLVIIKVVSQLSIVILGKFVTPADKSAGSRIASHEFHELISLLYNEQTDSQ